MLDSKKIENYLRLASNYGYFSLVPKNAHNIRVSNIKKLSGGVTNNTYSFLLTFIEKESEQSFDLVLKGYTQNVGLWFKTYHPEEDVRQYVREFQTLKNLERVGFPVPSVYLCESDPFFLGFPFVIMHKEKIIQENINNLDRFAATLAHLHNLEVEELEIKSLRFPRDSYAFAKTRIICLKQFLNETRHYRSVKRDFNYALHWLESNLAENNCTEYCLIHGEYHPGHTLMTDSKTLKVIDWEMVEIGDPAFDVGYAYHMVRLMRDKKNPNLGERAAERFVSEYTKISRRDVRRRLEFYKVVALLGVAVVVSSWISNPLEAYNCFGRKAFERALTYPFLRSNFLAKEWLNSDFLVRYLDYCQDFIETTLRR
jgi:aminoglycoside phosphotransferase (APT) family kinase protein